MLSPTKRDQLVCKQCNSYMREPVFLPCHCPVCFEQMHKAVSQCRTCANTVTSLSDEHLTPESLTLKRELFTLIAQYHAFCNTFAQELTNTDSLKSRDKFTEMRRQIELHGETLKAKVDQISACMLDQANSAEALSCPEPYLGNARK